VEQCTAGTLPAEGMAPDPAVGFHTLYREQERRKRVLGWRRTHKDPFDGEWEQITSWLLANPGRSSGDIFRELQRLSPGRYHPLQIRTHKPRNAQDPGLLARNLGGAVAGRSHSRTSASPNLLAEGGAKIP
jgi:hypothetical protein